MSNKSPLEYAKDLGIEQYLKPNMFKSDKENEESKKLIFTPDSQTFIYINTDSMKLGYYNKLSHLYYSYDLPTTPKETTKLKKVIMALNICLVEEKNMFSKFEPTEKILNYFK